MVPGDRSCLSVVVVFVGDDESVDGVGHCFHLFGPTVDGILDMIQRRMLNEFVLHGMEAESFEPVHALSPGRDVVVAVHQSEGDPLQMALAHLVDILECERARGEVAWVGIFLVALHVELLKVVVADDTFAADDRVALVVDHWQHTADGGSQVRDVGADMSVAACDEFCQPSIVVGGYQGESVEFPREPDGFHLSPLHQVLGLLGFCQRESRIFVGLFLSSERVGRDVMGRRTLQHSARFLFQSGEPVEECVPLIVGHQLLAAVIVCVGGFVELLNQSLHFLCLCHKIVIWS